MSDHTHIGNQQSKGNSATASSHGLENVTPLINTDEQLSPARVLQLQRMIGNRAVQQLLAAHPTAARKAIQRNIIVQNIDFNPLTQLSSDGYIRLRTFPGAVRQGLVGLYGQKPGGKQGAQNDTYGEVRPPARLDKVMEHINGRATMNAPDYAAPDIPALALLIANDIEAVYKQHGANGGWSNTVRNGIKDVVHKALVANLIDNHDMVDSEKLAFKQLIQQAGNNASRAKGQPTPLPMAKLGGVAAQVQTVHTAISNAHTAMTRAGFQFEWTDPNLMRQHFTMNYYQGNHTNNAGWLPNPAVPPAITNLLPHMRAAILAHAAVTALPALGLALLTPTAQAQVIANPAWQVAYTAAFNASAPVATHNDAAFRKTAWLALASGVSPYIEFAIPQHSDGISRLMYDFVGNNFYVTAHYKWSEGYNPFFHITDLHL